MRDAPINFGLMSYRAASGPWNAQRLVNWFAESSPPVAESKTPFILLPRPGVDSRATVTGECRGNYVVNDTLYSVFGATVYKFDTSFTPTAIGSITSGDIVYISDNADQLCVTADPSAWIYDFSSSVFSQITDTDFPGASTVTSMDGYFIFSRSGNSGEFFISEQGNGLAYDALDFATAEMASDNLRRVYVDHGELWLLGGATSEIWSPSGTSDFPFTRATNAGPERGIGAPDSIAKLDNTICWVGSDGIVYRASGYSPQAISTRPVELMIHDATDIALIHGRSYTQSGHPFYVLTSPGDWTLVYDATTGLWHERQTYEENYWKYVHPVQFNGEIIVGGVDGNLYALETETYTEAGGTIRFEATSPPVHANGQRVTMSKLHVLFEMGVGLTTGQGSDPQAMLQWSDDGGFTWSSEHWVSIGAIGQRTGRAVWRNLGQFFSRTFRVAVSDPVKPVIMGAYADFDVTPA